MTGAPDEHRWHFLSRMVEVRSPWLSMIGERLRDGTGQELEYWRVEKPDSLLVVTVHDGRLILPPRSYRPGVGRTTLDFAGGRLEDPSMILETAQTIVRREFKLSGSDLFASQESLNDIGWDVDSSSSSQRVYGIAAELRREVPVLDDSIGASYPATGLGGRELLRDLVCLQCRAVLHEWLEQDLAGSS
ncbi:MAG TPA: hypothetical protein VMU75_15725 [Acidimicrobiales bacterium]|nr:hypothetical protein [Acidimicrobiales bacterium]